MRIPPRALAALSIVVAAAALAAGCGSASEADEAADKARSGPLGWVDGDSVFVAQFDVQPGDIDDALTALDRLPIWAMARPALPADDGAGLYALGIDRMLDSEGGNLTYKDDVKPWFTGTGGVALTGGDEAMGEDVEDHVVVWLGSQDEARSRKAVGTMLGRSVTTLDHADVEYSMEKGHTKGDDVAVLAQDDVVLFGSKTAITAAIDTHENGDSSFAENASALAALEAASAGMLVGSVVRTKPLVEAGSKAIGDIDVSDTDSDRLAKLPAQARTFLASKELDAVVPDEIGFGIGFDDVGMRMRTTWSDPSKPASSRLTSRELVERLPAGIVSGAGSVSDPTNLEPMFALLDEAFTDFEIEPESLPATCPAEARAWCELGVTLLTMLQDEQLRDTLAAGDPYALAYGQSMDLSATLAGIVPTEKPEPAGPVTSYHVIAEQVEGEQAAAVTTFLEDERLIADLKAVGLELVVDGKTLSARVLPGSDLGTALAAMSAEQLAALSSTGIDIKALASGRPVTITAHEFEGVDWLAFPPAAEATLRASVEGGVDTLGDSDRYERTIDSVNPPKETATWFWLDYGALATGLDQLGPEVGAYAPIVTANLEHVGGFVGWTVTEEHAGEPVGVAEMTLPILE